MTPLNLTPDEKQVNLISKKPLPYIIAILLALLTLFVGLYINANKDRKDYCIEENAAKDRKIQALELRIDKLYDERDATYAELKKNTDSVLRAAIKPLLLKNNK